MKMRGATMIMAMAAAAVAAPLAVMADPPAVSAPTLPAPFIGAPMNDNPNNGQFTVNFDDQGRYLGTGTAPEHLANFDLSAANGPARPQAGSGRRTSAGEAAALDTVFAGFQQQLREVAASQSKSMTVGVSRR